MSTATVPWASNRRFFSATSKTGASTPSAGATIAPGMSAAIRSVHALSVGHRRSPSLTNEAMTQSPARNFGDKPPHMPKLTTPWPDASSAPERALNSEPNNTARTAGEATILASNRSPTTATTPPGLSSSLGPVEKPRPSIHLPALPSNGNGSSPRASKLAVSGSPGLRHRMRAKIWRRRAANVIPRLQGAMARTLSSKPASLRSRPARVYGGRARVSSPPSGGRRRGEARGVLIAAQAPAREPQRLGVHGVGERAKFIRVAVARGVAFERVGGGGVGIDFKDAAWQFLQKMAHARLGQRPRPPQSENRVGGEEAEPPDPLGHAPGQRILDAARRTRVRDELAKLARNANGPRAVAPRGVENHGANGRMKMIVLVDAHMVELQSRRLKGFELRLDLGAHLAAHRPAQRELSAEARKVGPEPAMAVHKPRNPLGRQGRLSVRNRDMQANPKARAPARARDGVGGRGPRDHETGRGQNSTLVPDLDRLVPLARQAKIVGGDDEAVQCDHLRRSRRKLMNSTPSRSRRTRNSGLFAISLTIAAIFGARK